MGSGGLGPSALSCGQGANGCHSAEATHLGATLLNRRHQLLRHLFSVPYWEWGGCNGAGEREQYLRGAFKETSWP